MDAPPLEQLRAIVARLRAPDGCPWDWEQTHASLRTALLEETYEVLAAIEAGDDPNLREELGDLLLHVVMHSQMASERGAFDFDAVAREIGEKMIRRHPHVFGGRPSGGHRRRPGALGRDQASAKKSAAGRSTRKATRHAWTVCPANLPALMRAQKAQEKAAKVGFDWRERVRRSACQGAGGGRRNRGNAARGFLRRRGRKKSVTCCSRRSISRAGTSSTPRRRCGTPRTSLRGVSSR